MFKCKKNLNFVAAILDFWRAFLYQFWPNFAHTYKIHLWISFVLCVAFKCQYFWSYSRKLIFDHLYTYFKGPCLTQKFYDWPDFFSSSGHSNTFFLPFESYRFLTCLCVYKYNFIPIYICFCVIALQIYIEMLKKYRKWAVTLEIFFFKNLKKMFLDSQMRKVSKL